MWENKVAKMIWKHSGTLKRVSHKWNLLACSFVLLFLINSISKIGHLSFQWHFSMTLKFLINLTGDKPCLTQKCFPIIQCLCSMHWWWWQQVYPIQMQCTNHMWMAGWANISLRSLGETVSKSLQSIGQTNWNYHLEWGRSRWPLSHFFPWHP